MTAVIFGLFACIGANCLQLTELVVSSRADCEHQKAFWTQSYESRHMTLACMEKTIPVWSPVEPED